MENALNKALEKANFDDKPYSSPMGRAYHPFEETEFQGAGRESVFRKSSANILAGMSHQKNRNSPDSESGFNDPRNMAKKNSPSFFGPSSTRHREEEARARKIRDFQAQDQLVRDIDDLLSR